MSRITDHFTWDEATVTLQRDPATGLLLPNQPDPQASASLVHTFSEMERVRSVLDPDGAGPRYSPIIVHSAYRSPEVNAAVGGAPTSQHMRGEAVDFHVLGLTVREVFERLVVSGLPFDQLIEETQTWVHISFVSYRRPRGQALTMRVVGGKAHYEPYARA